MTDDLLKRASAALREETADADEGARFTRARVMASLQQTQIRRRSRVALLLPLAACFAAASAFGMVSGHVPAFVHSVSHTLGLTEAPTPPAPTPPRRKAPLATPAPTATQAEPSELTPPPEPPAELATPVTEPRAPEPAPVPRLAPRPKERASALPKSTAREAEPKSSPAPAPTPTDMGDVSDRAHELYRVAHRSHFVDHDFIAALRAWDAYLDAAPNGRFVLEARYNRALCLVRLGRTHDARAALTPFAEGKFGGYRREEARSLIDAMDH